MKIKNVFVDAAQATGSLGVIRSLGRAGYRVYAGSTDSSALGFHSNYTFEAVKMPDYQDVKFINWFRKFIAFNTINMVIPSEALLLSLRENFDEFSGLLPMSSNKTTIYNGMSKWQLFATLREHGEDDHCPPYLLADRQTKLTDDVLGKPPFFIKLDQLHEISPSKYGGVLKSKSGSEMRSLVEASLKYYDRLLVQQYVAGVGCGVFLLVWGGNVIAKFMHLRLHEVPHTGGASSLRKSWWHQTIYDDAVRKVRCMGWEGVVMVEYRWNPNTDDFYLMEMNCRFWGSLHLAIFAGVDFPLALAQCYAGETPDRSIDSEPEKIMCRSTFPLEVQYVWSVLKDGELSNRHKIRTIFEFVMLFFHPRVRSDFLFPGDRMLYARRLVRTLREFRTRA